MTDTDIEWTKLWGRPGRTWNPVRGCSKISAGCRFCYAETFAERWRGVEGHPYEHGFDLRLAPHKLVEPLTWRRPSCIFANSMADLFHERIPLGYVETVLEVMGLAQWHVFQVLTKRAPTMRAVVERLGRLGRQLSDNVWLGVSVENRRDGIPRIEELRQTPAAVRFLSVEPLLEDIGEIDLDGIDWVIVGGESGQTRKIRPCDPDWVRSIRDQCSAQGVPFFFKQWGGVGLLKKIAGRELDGTTHNDAPACTALRPIDEPERRKRRETAARWAKGWDRDPYAAALQCGRVVLLHEAADLAPDTITTRTI